MVDIGWTIASVGAALIAVAGIVVFQRMLRSKRSRFPSQEEKALSQELTILGGSLVVLGIVFGTDRLIGYSLMGTGVLLSIIGAIKSRRKEQTSVETR